MNYSIKKIEQEILLVGLTIRTTNENMRCIDDMKRFWTKFYADNVPNLIPNKINQELTFGVYTNYESDYTGEYDYTIACQVSSFDGVPENMTKFVIPAKEFALFEITEKKSMHEKIGELWTKVWNSGYNRAYQLDFEVYRIPEKMTDDSDIQVSIYIS